MALEIEVKTYKKLLPSMLAEQGKYALISGESLIGTFVAYEDALKAGYAKCGVAPFLVKKISADEQISYFSRELRHPCPV